MSKSHKGDSLFLQGLQHRLYVLGVPNQIRIPLLSDVLKWKTCSGIEWTIKKLKSLKTDLFRIKAGLPIQTWVRKNRKGKLYGWVGSLFKFSNRDTKSFNIAVQTLNIYTTFQANSLTSVQKKKFLDGVLSQKVFIPPTLISDLRNLTKEQIGKCFIKPQSISPLITYRGSPSKKAPILNGKSVFQDSHLELEIEWFNDFNNWSFYNHFQSVYSPVFYGLEKLQIFGVPKFREFYSRLRDKTLKNSWKDVRCGEIHFLQEPGFKCRSIASPYRIHQLALKPLGDVLYNTLKFLPWDCTHQQDKAYPVIQKFLKNSKIVHSIDLTSFTDVFPLELQMQVLYEIFGDNNPHVLAFKAVSEGRWSSSIGEIRWNKGQPLGLYPSFALAGLTHGLLLALLAGVYHQQFFVLGDDVIILDDNLYERYIKTLELLECPWSPDKTISSNVIAEFAGKIILSDAIIPQFKWRNISDNNFIDICRNHGVRIRSLLSSKQRVVFDAVKHLLPPFGLNISCTGDNLIKFVERTDKFLSQLLNKPPIGNLVDLKSELDRKYLVSDKSLYSLVNTDELIDILSTFDEKVRRAFKNTLFNRLIDLCSYFAKGVHDIIPEYPRILPPPVFQPSHKTQLDRYMELLVLST